MAFTVKDTVLEARLTDFPPATLVLGHCLGAGLVAFLRAGHLDAKLLKVEVVDGTSVAYDVKLR
jgi:hypothetical protein